MAVGGYIANELDREVQVTDPSQVFFVQQGDGVIRVLTALEAQGIIRSGVLSRISMALRGDTFSVKPGGVSSAPWRNIAHLAPAISQ
jgi:cell division protein YceG involved in septum cleavage